MVPILCICISTYNKENRIERLVKEILKFQSSKIAVVVVDDNSLDNTVARLSQIKDARLSVFQNAENKGARGNWFETINHGYGKYILHLLDRDWVQVEYLQKVIDILGHEEAGFGYIGTIFSLAGSKNGLMERYLAGREALEKFAFVLVHPSGFLVKRSCWEALPDKEVFFAEGGYGIYPHSYIFALLAEKQDGILLHYPFVKVIANYARYKSGFYQHEGQSIPYWWMPDAHRIELEALTQYAFIHMNLSKLLLQNVLQYRFHENLYMATISYRDIAKNPRNASHYGVRVSYVEENELIRINIRFVWQYIMFIAENCKGIINSGFIWRILKIGMRNMGDILEYK